jgi:hypothetical protein
LKRIVVLVVAVAIAVPWISLAAYAPAKPALAASDSLPDLGMAQLGDFRIEKRSGGKRLLRFSSIVVNVGEGRFEVHGSRPDTSTATMDTVTQRIFDETGGSRDVVATGATMYFGLDGHNHWHVRDLESFTLERLSDKKKVGTGAKHGFCFFDNYRYGSTQGPLYNSCGSSGDLKVTMGLSTGWGDIYPSSLPDQYIDISGLPVGTYRLTAAADADGWFVEADEGNNSTWAELKIIKKGRVKVLGYGPGA